LYEKTLSLFLSEEIEEFQKKLNSKEYAPRRGYRRNVVVYTLLCYVNNITACYISKNEEPISIFIGRARKHMQKFPPEEWKEYYDLVEGYCNALESHLKTHDKFEPYILGDN
jgi:hypothetical protein